MFYIPLVYVLPRGWYVHVCMCPTFNVVYMHVRPTWWLCVCMCVHTYTYKSPSRYHITETLMMNGHRVTAHALHPEYWAVRFQCHKLGQTLGWFQACSPAFQLIPRSQETWLDRHYSKDLKLIVHVGYPCPLCLPRWRQDRKDSRKGI